MLNYLHILVFIIFIMYVLSTTKENNLNKKHVAGKNNFYTFYKNKKCSNISSISQVNNINTCKNLCFKSSNCSCMSYNLKTNDCFLSDNSNADNLTDANYNLSLIKNTPSILNLNRKLFNLSLESNSKVLGLYINKNSNPLYIELVELNNDNHFKYLDNLCIDFYIAEIDNKKYIVSNSVNYDNLNEVIVGRLISNYITLDTPTNKFKPIYTYQKQNIKNNFNLKKRD